jgi:hypothetical protein
LAPQDASQLVDIAEWPLDEEFAIFPVGSKPKRAVFCPTPAPYPFLIAGHRYLFKVSKGWRILQHWSEAIAYSLAQLCELPAAPAFIARDSKANEMGTLIEFFYGHPGSSVSSRFIAGADLLRRLVEDYEAAPDQHHTIGRILLLSRAFGIEERYAQWGRRLAFDALIGNTDRHPENWGLLTTRSKDGKVRFELAPSFDHGTSLAYQLKNESLARESAPERLKNHIRRGQHHARWSTSNPERGHSELCRLFAQSYEQAVPAMIRVAGIPMDEVKALVGRCARFDLSEGTMSQERADYLLKLIAARQTALKSAVEA